MKKIDKELMCWVALLCFIGASINTMGLLRYGMAISNITGNFYKSLFVIVSGKYTEFVFIFGAPIFFFLGTILSGVMFPVKEFILSKVYGTYLIFIGGILLASTIFFLEKTYYIYILCLITGMQNGMFIRYKGISCRTTHLTGPITDLGVLIGNWIRGNHENRERIFYFLFTVTASILGIIEGVVIYEKIGNSGVYIPALEYILVGKYCFKLRKEKFINPHLKEE